MSPSCGRDAAGFVDSIALNNGAHGKKYDDVLNRGFTKQCRFSVRFPTARSCRGTFQSRRGSVAATRGKDKSVAMRPCGDPHDDNTLSPVQLQLVHNLVNYELDVDIQYGGGTIKVDNETKKSYGSGIGSLEEI